MKEIIFTVNKEYFPGENSFISQEMLDLMKNKPILLENKKVIGTINKSYLNESGNVVIVGLIWDKLIDFIPEFVVHDNREEFELSAISFSTK